MDGRINLITGALPTQLTFTHQCGVGKMARELSLHKVFTSCSEQKHLLEWVAALMNAIYVNCVCAIQNVFVAKVVLSHISPI